MSLEPNIAIRGGDEEVDESFPREWLARQVAWERRLSVLSRRAEAELEARAKSTSAQASRASLPDQVPLHHLEGPDGESGTDHGGSGALHRLFGRRRITRSAQQGRPSRQKIAA